jgi:F0F1-type ATP synthase delta subunit
MKYSPRQYAEAFYELLKEAPHNHKKVIHELVTKLEADGNLKMAGEIMDHFKKIGEEEKPQISGARIRIGDTVIDNTIEQRLRNLKNVIAH